jgi:ABC-type polysaccharide/polyol phosphate export permease/Flp pilus assembly protein TadD
LNYDLALSSELIDFESFTPALAAGRFDACLVYLKRGNSNAASDAALNCRLAEALFHRNRQDESVECCRRASPWAGGDTAMLQVCAWVFSNCRCHDEAASAYRRLIALSPDRVGFYRHASGSLAAAGRIDEAIADGATASDLAPQNPEFAVHIGALLLNTGRYAEAAEYLDRAVALEPDNALALCKLSAACYALGESDEAVGLALRAGALSGGNHCIAIDAAELLITCGRINEAAELLRSAAGPVADPRLLRVLSAAEMLQGRLAAALDAVEQALAAAPDVAEYHIHRGHLLWRLDDLSGAALALQRAAALDPASRDLKRAQMSLYLAAGLVSEATAVGGELLHRFPDDQNSAEAVVHLLTHRLDAIDGEYVVLNDGIVRAPRTRRPPPRWPERLRSQYRVVAALIIRETRTRFADSKLGYGWALIEPILHITLLSVTFAVLMNGQPPIGTQFFIFYYTGLVPYLVFVHASSGMSHAITGNGPVLQLPPVTTADVIAARGLLEITTDLIVAVILLVGFGAVGLAAMPDDLWGPAMALLATAAFGCGIGYINAVVTVFVRSWDKVYGQVTRVLYFTSGIFYVPGMMPDWARDILAWNPLLHAIDWFRAGFFASYQPHWLDRSYLVILAILALLCGLGLERGLRRKLCVPL